MQFRCQAAEREHHLASDDSLNHYAIDKGTVCQILLKLNFFLIWLSQSVSKACQKKVSNMFLHEQYNLLYV